MPSDRQTIPAVGRANKGAAKFRGYNVGLVIGFVCQRFVNVKQLFCPQGHVIKCTPGYRGFGFFLRITEKNYIAVVSYQPAVLLLPGKGAKEIS